MLNKFSGKDKKTAAHVWIGFLSQAGRLKFGGGTPQGKEIQDAVNLANLSAEEIEALTKLPQPRNP